MQLLYDDPSLKKYSRRAFVSGFLSAFFLFGGITACIALCFFINTANAGMRLKELFIISVSTGWLFLGIFSYVYLPSRAQKKHIFRCMSEEKSVFLGHAHLTSQEFSVPGSITVLRVTVDTEEETIVLHLNSVFRKRFPKTDKSVRFYTVNKYIVAYEVLS